MLEEMRRMAIVTSGVAELTKNRAEQIVRDLVKAGDVRRDQTSQLVKELVSRSAENRRELTRFVRSEITAQIENLGVAGKRDVEKLERRITRLEDAAREKPTAIPKAGGKKTTAGKKTSRRKTTTNRTTAKSTGADKASATGTAIRTGRDGTTSGSRRS